MPTRCRLIGRSCLEGTSTPKVPVVPTHGPTAPVNSPTVMVHIIPALPCSLHVLAPSTRISSMLKQSLRLLTRTTAESSVDQSDT